MATIGAKPLDHLRRTWTAIDQIADEHQQGLARRPAFELRVDLLQKRVEQVEPAVDIADDIGAVAARAGRALPLWG